MSARHPTPWTVHPYGSRELPRNTRRGRYPVENLFAVLDANRVIVADTLDADTAVEIANAVNARAVYHTPPVIGALEVPK